MAEERHPSKTTFACLLLAAVVIFIADIFTPLGYTLGLLYLIPALICVRVHGRGRAIALAIPCSLFLLGDVFLSPPHGSMLMEIVNDSLVAVVMWVSVFAGLAFVRNAEELSAAQRDRHLSEEQLRAVFNAVGDAIIVIDQQGIITAMNPATETLFGYAAGELIGNNVNVLMPTPYSQLHNDYIVRYRHTAKRPTVGERRELTARRKDGKCFPASISVSEIDDSGGFTGVVHDLTERRELQMHLLNTAATEQQRLGRELHDGIGQELTGLRLIAGTTLEILKQTEQLRPEEKLRWLDGASGLAKVKATVAKLDANLAAAHQHVQELSRGVLPVQVDAEGLQAALEELAQTTNLSEHVSCRFDCPRPVTVASNTAAMHLYRIAQEALTNALRHSQADEICLSLQQTDGQLILEINDNGCGLDATDAKKFRGGLGLRTMHFRAETIGGTLHIEPGLTRGTSVKCILPNQLALP